ncbi:MAG: Xaa-Pro dipeptidyl-peptidase, partial [Arenibacter sp.]|nr:Xaa-Pro dipeptidyl-peptidase [Arenibacter sp.]
MLIFLFGFLSLVSAQKKEAVLETKAVPIFKDGEAQVVPGFNDETKWIRHDLWVETEFDTDGDGKKDRMHVSVTRPQQTETEGL